MSSESEREFARFESGAFASFVCKRMPRKKACSSRGPEKRSVRPDFIGRSAAVAEPREERGTPFEILCSRLKRGAATTARCGAAVRKQHFAGDKWRLGKCKGGRASQRSSLICVSRGCAHMRLAFQPIVQREQLGSR
jgi:hypothetical protein